MEALVTQLPPVNTAATAPAAALDALLAPFQIEASDRIAHIVRRRRQELERSRQAWPGRTWPDTAEVHGRRLYAIHLHLYGVSAEDLATSRNP